MKKPVDNNTIIVGDFNTPLTTMDRSSKQIINRETMALNDTLDQMDLTDIFRFNIYYMNLTYNITYMGLTYISS